MDPVKQWTDIENALRRSNIGDSAAIADLKSEFDAMNSQLRETVLAGAQSSIGSKSTELKYSRDLFRAYNFLVALRDQTRYRLDEALKQRAHSDRTAETDLVNALRRVYEEIRSARRATTPVTPLPALGAPAATTSLPARSLGPPRASTKLFEIALGLRGNAAARNDLASNHAATRRAATRFLQLGAGRAFGLGREGQAPSAGTGFERRTEQAVAFVSRLDAAWTGARRDIKLAFANQRISFWNRLAVPLQTATEQAFKNVNANVRANQERLQKRIDLVKQCFEALADAPPPLSLIGKIGSKVAGVAHAAEYDPTLKYATWKGADGSKFVAFVAEQMEEFEKATQIGATPNVPKEANITAAFQTVNNEYDRLMEAIVEGVLDRIFPIEAGKQREKLERLRREYVAQVALGGGMSFLQHRDNMIDSAIEQFKNDTIEKIRSAFRTVQDFDADDMRIAVEMWLYCGFVKRYWPNQQYTIDLDEGILSFFAQAGDWQVIERDTKNHAQSAGRRHLNWKGGENHKRALELFCRWYSHHINPFHMAAGVMRDGRPYNGAAIREACRKQIDIINRAIDQGRTVNRIGWSSWEWNRIYQAYEQFVNVEHKGNFGVQAYDLDDQF